MTFAGPIVNEISVEIVSTLYLRSHYTVHAVWLTRPAVSLDEN